MKKITQFLFVLLVLQVVLTACSSTKSRDEQGLVARTWHNMNSHYNGYFNAEELLEESLLVLEEQHVDNYTQRLAMFPFLEVDNVSIVSEDMDRAIEKVAIVVKKHPYSNWVDDSYLLVGQAQLIKQDYESAERTLRFMVNEFRPRAKRKKSKGKRGAAAGADSEEEEFVSKREVEADESSSRRDRLRARKEAQKERDRVNKERARESKRKKKEREKERKARIRARKKGIRLPPRTRDTSANQGLENEPEEELVDELDEGPVGMISIFARQDAEANAKGEQYGKKSGSYALKHRPAYQEGRLWLAWTLIKRDNYDRAQIILEDLRADRGTFADVRRKAIAVQAFLYLEQNDLENAIPFLEAAAEVAQERNERARYYYIAGQLYQELNNAGPAMNAFEQVVAARPAYELELGARINMAQNSFLSGTGSADGALKDLERMVRQEKNLPYQGQILFSMAGISIRDGNAKAGAEYLQRAVASPYAQANQQQEAYQLLGDLSYTDEDYLSAKLYYDSTLNVMARNDTRYPVTNGRRDNLTGIATNLQTITLKDSLLRIGTLPAAERRKLAEEIFELRRATNSAANYSVGAPTPGGRGIRQPIAGVTNSSDFWAYDKQILRRGQKDFEREWGDRALEDNWRRSQRSDAGLFIAEGDAAGPATEAAPVIMTDEELDKIMADVPTDEASQTATRTALGEAYFNLGRDYRDRLENNNKAIEALETMDRLYPGGNNEAEAWYLLYLMHTEENRQAQAQSYAQKLQGKYKGSKFEKLASDPTYAATLLSEDNKLNREYEAAYTEFEAGHYQQAFDLAERGRKTILGQHPLKPRYALLLAMSTGKLQGREAYVAGLRQVVSQFGGTPEEVRAKEILRLLGEGGARLPGQASSGSSGFKVSPDELHYLIVVFEDQDVKLNDAKIAVSEYNQKYHKLDRLRITNVYLGQDNDLPVLVMRRFKTGEDAMSYFNGSREHEDEFLDPGRYGFKAYAVSQSNYREILKARSVEGYEGFFQENYLR